MHLKILGRLMLLTPTAILAFLIGCIGVQVGDVKIESESVDLGSAKSVRAQLRIGAGELRVSGGANKLLEADFIYNIPSWKPAVSYEISNNLGSLIVQQPKSSGFPQGNVRYEWNLSLNNAVPIDLNVELGAGKSELELGGLSLTGLDIQMGAGEVTVDLNGDWNSDFDASIKGGVGKLTLRLPRDVGVRVDATKGIGSIHTTGLKAEGRGYVNEAFGKSKVTLRIQMAAGIGDIHLEAG